MNEDDVIETVIKVADEVRELEGEKNK